MHSSTSSNNIVGGTAERESWTMLLQTWASGLLLIALCCLWPLPGGIAAADAPALHADLRELLKHHDPHATNVQSEKFKAINGLAPEWLEGQDKLECREIRKPPFSLAHLTSQAVTTRSTCCLIDPARGLGKELSQLSRVKCLPSFIIGGTQKSGTTVLSAYLASHPAISFPAKKEVHYFSDGRKQRNVVIRDYFQHFKEWNYTSSGGTYDNGRRPRINGEATPYYLASRESCAKIAATLPHVKFIVLMREPVARLWSEYQMKKRRVETQNSFIELCARHAAAMRACLLSAGTKSAGAVRWAHIAECSPPDMLAHVNWAKFKASMTQRVNASTTWEARVDMCFAAKRAAGGAEAQGRRRLGGVLLGRNGSSSGAAIGAGLGAGAGRTAYASWGEADGPEGRGGYRNHRPRGVAIRADPPTRNATLPPTLSRPPSLASRRRLRGQDTAPPPSSSPPPPGPPIVELAIPAHRGGGDDRVEFLAHKCLNKHASESLRSVATFEEELKTLKKCAGSLLDGTLDGLDKAVTKCVKIRVGIAANFVYRSLYVAQLHHCLKSIPRESFLLLPSELLQRDPQGAMNRVQRFLGVPMADAVRQLARQQLAETAAGERAASGQSSYAQGQGQGWGLNASFISQAVRAHFPKFELNTGWSPVGVQSYEPMDPAVQRSLTAFFQPYNQMLFALLGEDWSGYWGAGNG